MIYQEEVFDGEKRVFGLCDPYLGKIYVATKSLDGDELSEDAIQHHIHHEVEHYKMHFVDQVFYRNERKIDLLGALTAQYEKTKVMG